MVNTPHDESEVFKDEDDGHEFVMDPRYIRHDYVMKAYSLKSNFGSSSCCCDCCCSDHKIPLIDPKIYGKLSEDKRITINKWKMEYLHTLKRSEAAILEAEAILYKNIAKSLGSKLK